VPNLPVLLGQDKVRGSIALLLNKTGNRAYKVRREKIFEKIVKIP